MPRKIILRISLQSAYDEPHANLCSGHPCYRRFPTPFFWTSIIPCCSPATSHIAKHPPPNLSFTRFKIHSPSHFTKCSSGHEILLRVDSSTSLLTVFLLRNLPYNPCQNGTPLVTSNGLRSSFSKSWVRIGFGEISSPTYFFFGGPKYQ